MPAADPRTIAANVLISSSPLARESARSGTISGTMPYLAGLKNADWVAIRKRTTSIHSSRPFMKATMPTAIATTSKTVVTTRTVRLL